MDKQPLIDKLKEREDFKTPPIGSPMRTKSNINGTGGIDRRSSHGSIGSSISAGSAGSLGGAGGSFMLKALNKQWSSSSTDSNGSDGLKNEDGLNNNTENNSLDYKTNDGSALPNSKTSNSINGGHSRGRHASSSSYNSFGSASGTSLLGSKKNFMPSRNCEFCDSKDTVNPCKRCGKFACSATHGKMISRGPCGLLFFTSPPSNTHFECIECSNSQCKF